MADEKRSGSHGFMMLIMASAALALVATASAEDVLHTVRVSGSPLSTTGDVSIIDRTQIAQQRGQSLAQILASSHGIQTYAAGGPQATTGLFVRGAQSKHVTILLDGVPINSASTGAAQLPLINPAMVERVEIMRGAAASLHGYSALGGVINILTRKDDEAAPLSLWANAGAGDKRTHEADAGLSGKHGRWDYRLAAGWQQSEGTDAQHPYYRHGDDNTWHHPDRDGYRGRSFSAALGYRWHDDHRIGLTAYDAFLRGDYDDGPDVAHAHARTHQNAWVLESDDAISEQWHSRVQLGVSNDRSHAFDSFGGRINNARRFVNWRSTWQWHPDHRLTTRIEYQQERVRATTPYTGTSRRQRAVGLMYDGRVRQLHMQASVRHDHATHGDGQLTGALGMDVDLTDRWQVGVAADKAMHRPTFNDLYYPGFSNPHLQAEMGRNLEAYLQYAAQNTHLRLTAYRNRVRQLIAVQGTHLANIDRATLRGISFALSHNVGDTRFSGSFDYLDAHTRDAAGRRQTLPQRARHVWQLAVTHELRDWSLHGEYRYVGHRTDTVNWLAGRTRLASYRLLNLMASYRFNPEWTLQLRLNNALHENYTQMDGYRTRGRHLFAHLAWHW